jgi:hypothetical protein
MRTNMATCVKCGRPIGLIEYVSGDSQHHGLCKACRTNGDKWCKDCVHMLAIRNGETSVLRCIKFGYDLSKRKDWTCANNCKAYATRVIDKNPERERVYSTSHK